VNPQWHDEFVALCALFPSGELTEEEWALLQVHLAYCNSCRVTFDQFQRIASDVIPIMASSAALGVQPEPEASSFSLHAAEKRLMSRLDSAPSDQAPKVSTPTRWQTYAGTLAACIAVAAALIALPLHRSKSQPAMTSAVIVPVESHPDPNETSGAETELRSRLEAAEHRVTELEQQTNAAEERTRQSNSTANNIEQQLDAEKNERKKISDERDALSRQLAAAQTEAQSLRDKSSVANVAASQQGAQLGVLEAKLHDVNAALDEKDRMLALDKEFLAHDREIRDLIAARDLYIADIYDVAQNGKTNKPFGRVFYTKDKSLVFYGYDLDKQAGLKQSVAFQAWGSGNDKQNVSLGIFYQDETNKRWVLQFNDTKTLARLNMVFVTAEPKGGSTKPTGKPLLLAYLQVQPNHP
jgi:Anti-sigma-K factor rskA